jgi:far upstream element-binding protein
MGGPAAQSMSAFQGMSATPQQAPAADPNAPDPYAPYGGYQAYCAMWYAALAQNGQAGQGQAQMPPQ